VKKGVRKENSKQESKIRQVLPTTGRHCFLCAGEPGGKVESSEPWSWSHLARAEPQKKQDPIRKHCLLGSGSTKKTQHLRNTLPEAKRGHLSSWLSSSSIPVHCQCLPLSKPNRKQVCKEAWVIEYSGGRVEEQQQRILSKNKQMNHQLSWLWVISQYHTHSFQDRLWILSAVFL
jgi:hypothetical protein